MTTTFPEPSRLLHDVDKSSWPQGEWSAEPDKVQWVDPDTQLDCLIVRQPHSGHLCGYVGVPEGHPLFMTKYEDVDCTLECHGGLTFSDLCAEDGGRICHVPFPGRTEHIWWFGFDCNHGCDSSPARDNDYKELEHRYKSISYVKDHCTFLAHQIKELYP